MTADGPDVVVIVEDDAPMRDAMALLLGSVGLRTVEHGSAEEVLAAGMPAGVRCVVADVRLGAGMDGIRFMEALRARGDATPVVVVTGHGDVPLAVRAMRAGALDFVEKPFEPERLLTAVREASPPHRAPSANSLGSLTPREREVLRALAEGAPNKLVAHGLGISVRTVEVYRASIMDKLGAKSFAELVRIALRAGM
jgi:two-component system response regulator FixJ